MARRFAFLIAVAAVLASSAHMVGEEGMWTFDAAPLARINAALGTGIALQFDLPTCAAGIANCPIVAGRFEQVRLDKGQTDFAVIVDYAHTDDALRNVLQTAREVAGNRRVITVFGCGGDRDRTGQRPAAAGPPLGARRRARSRRRPK